MKEPKSTTFSKDRTIVLVTVFNMGLIIASVVSVLFRLRPNDLKIPVQYVVYDGSIVQTGNWFSLYSLAFFVIAGGIVTTLLAKKMYVANKSFALTVLLTYTFVALFSLLTINALLGLVERV